MTLRTQRTNGGLDHRNLRIIRVFIMNLWGPNLSSPISLQFSCFVAEMFITYYSIARNIFMNSIQANKPYRCGL